MQTRFVPNPLFQAEIQRTPQFRKGVTFIAVGVAEHIKTAALPFRDTGNYIKRVSPRSNRINLEKHFAHIMEFGSINNPPQGNVRRGVTTAGLRFVDDGRKQAD